MNLYTIIILVGVFFYLCDIHTSKNMYDVCRDDIHFHFFLLFHHILKSYILLGWYSKNKTHLMFYVGVIVFVMLDWYTNNNKCFFTEYIKDKCKNKDYIFKDIFYYTGKKNDSDIYYYTFYSFLILYVVKFKLKII